MKKVRVGSTGKSFWQTPILERDAADFIRADGGGFIFHNRIPYLRPAGFESAGTEWYETEWKKKSVREDATDDLRVLRQQTGSRIVAFCTSKDSEEALLAADYDPQNIVSWKAHPSRHFFHPSKFEREDIWFQGKNHFQC